MVVDTFALDPGELADPCDDDMTEDRLLEAPFLRLQDGYQLVVPLDLLLTVRHHLLRFAYQENELEELGKRYRAAALRRVERLLPRDAERQVLSVDRLMNRYLFSIDAATDVHVIVATDNLADWSPEQVWGMYDTSAVLDQIGHLIRPDVRSTYSPAESLLHLVITDSPGRSAFWGVPNVDGADPVLMARADDLEVMLHREPDGALGLFYFTEAADRRPSESMTTNMMTACPPSLCSRPEMASSNGRSSSKRPTVTAWRRPSKVDQWSKPDVDTSETLPRSSSSTRRPLSSATSSRSERTRYL
jgi:hypothetical protein